MNRFLWGSYGIYFLGGITSVLFGAVMPELLLYYNTSYTSGGLLILLQSIGFIVGVPLTAFFMKRYHYRLILSGAALIVAFAQIGVLFLPRLEFMDLIVILNGIGDSALETAVASYVMELFEGRRAISMSRLEVSFGLGALAMPAVASGLIFMNLWRVSFVLVAALALVLAAMWQTISVSLEYEEAGYHMDARTAAPPKFLGGISKYTVLAMFLVMIFVYVGVEGSLNSFLPSLFTVYVKIRPSLASLSSSVFWIAMVCGRLAIGWIARRITYERYLLASLVFSISFFVALTQFHGALLSYLIVFGLGLAMSAVYSVTMVYANHTFPGMERTVTAAVTAFAGMGGAVFPGFIGYAMDHLLPNEVLWLISAFATALLLFFLLISGSLGALRRRHA